MLDRVLATNDIDERGVWPSPFNTVDRPGGMAGRVVRIADCTLRDGEQQAGIALDQPAKVRIAEALAELDVYEIEAGTPASSVADADAVREICRLNLGPRVSVVCRAKVEDVDLAASLGVWGVRISLPISQIQRKAKLAAMSDDRYLELAALVTGRAKEHGLHVIFSPFDTTRADLDFVKRVAKELQHLGTIDRLRVVDTTGCALPSGIRYLVGQLGGVLDATPIEIHCHNDFGLATANTLAGVEAGASYVSTTMNGIGERAGNAATEEVAIALLGLYGIDLGINTALLRRVSELTAALTKVPVQAHKAVVGDGAFSHESGMVVAGILEDPYTAEPYPPELVGQRRTIVVGKKSGVSSLEYKAETLGIDLAGVERALLLETVKDTATSKGRALTDDEFLQTITDIAATQERGSNAG
jgi:isopropylmalate/homocitrate/citramalate synthase